MGMTSPTPVLVARRVEPSCSWMLDLDNTHGATLRRLSASVRHIQRRRTRQQQEPGHTNVQAAV